MEVAMSDRDWETLNRLTHLHGASNVNNYLRKFGNPSQGTNAKGQKSIQVQPKNPIHLRTGKEMSDWYYHNVYLVNKRNAKIKARNRRSHQYPFKGLSRIY